MTTYHDILLREQSDANKPSFSRLRYEGLSDNACIALYAARDALAKAWPADRVVRLIEGTGAFPFTASDVPPMHRPEIPEPVVPVTDDWDALAVRVLADWDRAEERAS